MKLEYVNPLAGLGMIVIGLILITSAGIIYGGPPLAVGIFLVAYYRKYLLEIMGLG